MSARRCAIGCETWPDEMIFSRCSYCGEPTRRIGNLEPTVDREEATRVKLYELFDEFYERRCASLGIPSEGPLPAETVPC